MARLVIETYFIVILIPVLIAFLPIGYQDFVFILVYLTFCLFAGVNIGMVLDENE